MTSRTERRLPIGAKTPNYALATTNEPERVRLGWTIMEQYFIMTSFILSEHDFTR